MNCLAANDVRIYSIYSAGGNSGATYNRDFIILYNSSSSTIDLNGWSVQYASANGTTWNNKLDLSGMIAGQGFFLLALSSGTNGINLPVSPDQTGTIAMGAGGGKVALMNTTTTIPTGTAIPATYIDFVGYGTATSFEGTNPAPAPSTTTAIYRRNSGQDTDDNSADFLVSDTSDPSIIRVTNSSSFPIDLISFKAKNWGQKNHLEWSTSFENNFSHFEILRSADAKGFESIGKVMGTGKKKEGNQYSFVDEHPRSVDNYYQLKQVDLDGKVEYSKIIHVFNTNIPELVIYPNPASDEIRIKNIDPELITSISIKDELGRILRSLKYADQIDISNLKEPRIWVIVHLKNGSFLERKIVKL